MSLFNLINFPKKKSRNSIELDYNKLPVMGAEELIHFTGQQNRIMSIKRIVKIDNERFQILYLDVIYNFAELVQLMPASQAHHHAVPGGLFIHTLEVIEHAMRLRQQYKLPAFAEPEVQERERHAWTYAIFVAAILHDIGKRVSMCSFLCKEKAYSAYEAKPLSQTTNKNYKLVFHKTKYHELHEKIGLSLIDIIPPAGKIFIFSNLRIVKEMMAYIHGDKFNHGMIGEIIIKADKKSTGESLAHSPTRKFKGASKENIGERLMTQLRLMIASNDFIINKSNANIYTTDEGYTYCVSKVIVDAIREQLQKENVTDIPADNNRIFDIFQEYGFAETNHYTGKSIHYVQIFHNGNSKVFTVLKFRTNKLFQVLPEKFDGKIEEIRDKESAKENKIPTVTANETSPPETVTENQTPATELSSNDNNKNDILDKISTETATNTPSIPATEKNNYDKTGEDIFAKTPPEPVTENQTPATEKNKFQNSDKTDLASDFLEWCRKNILEKSIIINESYGPIQKVSINGSSVIALVTPRIFSMFAESIGMANPTDKSTFTKIQSKIHQKKLNIPAARGQIHVFKIKKSINNALNKNIKIRHYLFAIDVFCGNDNEVKEIINKIDDNTNLVKI